MARDRNGLWSALAALAALAFHAVNGLIAALASRFPAALDELQHLSFIRSMEAGPTLFPDYSHLRVLDAVGQRFTATTNYLNHPSPYYLLMGLADRAVGGSVLGLRLVNLGLSLAAVALMLVAGFRVLKRWPERAVFAAAVVLFPKLGVIAGLINNDNGALLAVAVAFFGVVEWQRTGSVRSAALLALGVTLCGWTKFTVLVMAASAFAVAEAFGRLARAKRPSIPAYAIIAAGLAIAAIPTLANLAAYSRPLYHPAAYYYVPPAHRLAWTIPSYLVNFIVMMGGKWSALEPAWPIHQAGLVLILAACAAVVVRALRAGRGEGEEAVAWRIAAGFVAATGVSLILHFQFGWSLYKEDGAYEPAQPRYYYGVWPGIALGLALLWRAAPPGLARNLATVILAICLVSSSLLVMGLVFAAHGHGMAG